MIRKGKTIEIVLKTRWEFDPSGSEITPKSLFPHYNLSAKLQDREEDRASASENEDTDAQMAPVGKLEDVAISTGEEDEDPILDLRAPTSTDLENGLFKCMETGHEVLAKDRESYSHSKSCSLVFIDFAWSQNKLPFNMFKQDPLSYSKLICKLIGDTIYKSEEHIWKHINGKRFLNKLEVKEVENLSLDGIIKEHGEPKLQKAGFLV
ncbi:hypothetical protein F2P56_017806 [Juglans regia]|uniref:Uncharacterized protein n=1 Tax=Juglans regia TaxID=51240 RepID=A0A833TKL8_JUGRE|nr:hypothetical protein F2P56_017806 [Juglans regia]